MLYDNRRPSAARPVGPVVEHLDELLREVRGGILGDVQLVGRALGDRPVEQALRRGCAQQRGHRRAAGALPEHGHIVGVAAERGDVALHPLQRGDLVAQAGAPSARVGLAGADIAAAAVGGARWAFLLKEWRIVGANNIAVRENYQGAKKLADIADAIEGTYSTSPQVSIGPDGKLVPLDQLKAESPEQRAQRVQAVRAAQARQRADKVEVSTFGFRRTPAPVASVPAPVAAAKASPLTLTRADLDRMSRKELIAAAKAVGIDGAGGHKSDVLRQRIEAEIIADARRKQAANRPTPELPRPAPLTPQEVMRTVASAFQRLQTATNQVSIADLKDATGLDVPTLHQAINDLRRAGVLTGSQAERQIDARARASMIREEGSLIVYLSLRHGMLAALRSIAGLV